MEATFNGGRKRGISMTRCHLIAIAALRAIVCATAFSLAQFGSTGAQEITALDIHGSLFIAGKTPLYPSPKEPRDTHAYVTLEGAGALALYKNMKRPERQDACRGDGWKLKSSHNLVCSISNDQKQAECDFAIRMRDGVLHPGRPC
jgi:hypothetical protein